MSTAPSRYLVLHYVANEGHPAAWEEVGTFNASSTENALRQFGGSAGVYVAVPVRSWKPVELTVEKVERVKIAPAAPSEASA